MAYLKTMVMRRRGVLLKLLVALPSLWLVATLVTLSDKPDKDAVGGGGPVELPPAVRPRDSNHLQQQQQPPQPPPQPPQPPPSPPLPQPQQPELKEGFGVMERKPEVKTKTEEPHEVSSKCMGFY